MGRGARKNPVLGNPFFIALMGVSTVFVVSALAWALAVPVVLERDAGDPGLRAVAGWLDRHGPMVLGIEFAAMLVTGVAAMLTEDWFMRS